MSLGFLKVMHFNAHCIESINDSQINKFTHPTLHRTEPYSSYVLPEGIPVSEAKFPESELCKMASSELP